MKVTHTSILEYFFYHFKGIKETGDIFIAKDKSNRYYISDFSGTPTNYTPRGLKATAFYNWMVEYKQN